MAQSLGQNVIWYGAEFKRKFDEHLRQNLNEAAIYLRNDIVKSFGDSGVKGKRSGATKAERAANRSLKDEPPHVQTGHLRNNVGYDTPPGRPHVRRIGTGVGNKKSVGYAMFLELGTSRMDARPYLRPAVQRSRSAMMRILSKYMKG